MGLIAPQGSTSRRPAAAVTVGATGLEANILVSIVNMLLAI